MPGCCTSWPRCCVSDPRRRPVVWRWSFACSPTAPARCTTAMPARWSASCATPARPSPASPQATPRVRSGEHARGHRPGARPVDLWLICEFRSCRSGVEALLQRARRREFRRLAGRDMDGLAGGGIASLASRPVADTELAEAGKCNLTSARKLAGDHFDSALEHLPGLAGRQPVAPRDLLG